jgi:stress-induced morphogen
MTNRAMRIEAALRRSFTPAVLVVQDDSHQHAGHSGASPSGETHYSVVLVTPEFEAVSRVARSRMVHELLAGEFAGGLHALALTLRTPREHSVAATHFKG